MGGLDMRAMQLSWILRGPLGNILVMAVTLADLCQREAGSRKADTGPALVRGLRCGLGAGRGVFGGTGTAQSHDQAHYVIRGVISTCRTAWPLDTTAV